MKLGIVNYGVGNIGSVYSAFNFYKYVPLLINTPDDLKKIDIIIMTGVGNFTTAISKLKEHGLWEVINYNVINKGKPILGICLGMQLFADISFEKGENKGFGWIKGKVIKMKSKFVRIPHIGWNKVNPLNDKLFDKMRYNNFYFMHSYQFIPEDKNVITGITKYGDIEIVSSIKKDNIVGVQFHPEKSQGDGLRFLKNFLEVYQNT